MNNAISRHPLLRFLIVGAASTVVNYSVYLLFYLSLWRSYEVAFFIGFLSGVMSSYQLNRAWTFQITSGHHSQHMWRYLTVYATSLLIGFFCIKLSVGLFDVDPLFANIGIIFVTTCINYLGTRFWTFDR